MGGYRSKFPSAYGGTVQSSSISFASVANTASNTFATINDGGTGVASFSMVVPKTGKYRVSVFVSFYGVGATLAYGDFRLNIDSGAQYVGAATTGTTTLGTPSDWTWRKFTQDKRKNIGPLEAFVTLTAGTHTIAVEWAKYTGDMSPTMGTADTCKVMLQLVEYDW